MIKHAYEIEKISAGLLGIDIHFPPSKSGWGKSKENFLPNPFNYF
jgi:hypothetical protein